jgi:uncharacterized protein (DUF302 family)
MCLRQALAAPGFVARGGGTIVNIASIVAISPETLNGVYGGSKAFVLALSQSLSRARACEDAVVGRPNMAEFRTTMAAATTFSEMQQVIQHALGKSGFMEFLRFDLGSIIQRERGQGTPKILRLVIGNPLVMKELVKHVADAGSYAPVTVLVDERPDGVHLSYDKMESFLTPYGNPDAVKVARDLDAEVEALLIEAAG